MKSLVSAVLALLLVASTSACGPKKIMGETSGSVIISDVGSCNATSPEICYDLSGTLAGGNIKVSGSGSYDPNACTTSKNNGACCPQNVTGVALSSFDGESAEADFIYTGESCVKSKKPTIAKLSKGVLMVTGTAGAIKGAQGMGKVKYIETCDSACAPWSPGPGTAKIHVSGNETEAP